MLEAEDGERGRLGASREGLTGGEQAGG